MAETSPPPKKKRTGSIARTLRSLLIISTLGIAFASYSVYTNNRDVRLATGPESEAQEAFFIDAAERPDVVVFVKNLTPVQRLEMSKNIGRYDDPRLAKLIGKALGTFDASARAALTKSLASLALQHPEAVAQELALKGSFQQLGVMEALQAAGPRALPLVAERLTNGDARPNAAAYLVSAGPAAIPPLMPMLEHEDKDVRVAAADALGKLRAREAVQPLERLYRESEEDEKVAYLTALSGIGDPATEPLMQAAVQDEAMPVAHRSQAALGLGRIATESAISTLWSLAKTDHHALRQNVITALQVAGDRALARSDRSMEERLDVARGVRSAAADALVRTALAKPATTERAATAAANREALVPDLLMTLNSLDVATDGDAADALVRSLASTPKGIEALKSLDNEALSGLVQRRLQMTRT